MDPTPTGWLLPESSLVLLEGPDDGLELITPEGARLAVFEGELARAVRDVAGGGAAPSPLLRTLLAHTPGLADALSRGLEPLAPAPLLRRGGWSQLFVELTARCNEACLHCYAESSPDRSEALDRPTAEAVVREAAALGFPSIQLTGGEALLWTDLAELCRLARDEGIATIEVYTNGLLLNDARYAPLRASGVAFAFSLYAATPEVHDRVTTVPGSHARTVAAIQRAVGGGSSVRVGVIVTRPEDAEQARAAQVLARELGVERVGVDVSREVGRGVFADSSDPGRAGASAPSGTHKTDARGGGTAAVLPDGWVVPCIFSRRLRLGRVGPDGGLTAALTNPAVRLRPEACARRLAANAARMTCAGCRVTDALLA